MPIFDSIGIAATGATTYRKWLDAVSDNISNMNDAVSPSAAAFQARYVVAQPASDGNGDAGARVVVEFADTGTGMTEDVRAHIFDPLYTTKKRGRGTGLGLVVVRQVVGEHGGSIEVESEPGRGARFRLDFPAASQGERDHDGTASVSERVTTVK